MKTCVRLLTPVALLAVISIAACGTASADTLVVTSAADDGWGGTLRDAIYAAQDGDTIVFDSSLNGKTIVLIASELLIDKDLTIQGPGPDKLAISGSFGVRVFEVGTEATISGLSLVEGGGRPLFGYPGASAWSWDDVVGGAICNWGNLTLNNCVVTASGWDNDWFVDSHVYKGGGIANYGAMTINDSTVTNNAVGQSGSGIWGGGGIYNAGIMEINRSSVFDNYLLYEGILYINNIYNTGTLKIHHSYIQKPHKQ